MDRKLARTVPPVLLKSSYRNVDKTKYRMGAMLGTYIATGASGQCLNPRPKRELNGPFTGPSRSICRATRYDVSRDPIGTIYLGS